MVARYQPKKKVERRISTKVNDWERAKEVRIRANREKHVCDRIAYRMAAAYVAGEYGGNYLHWIAAEDRNISIADQAIDRMLFVIDEVRRDKVLSGALVHYLMRD